MYGVRRDESREVSWRVPRTRQEGRGPINSARIIVVGFGGGVDRP